MKVRATTILSDAWAAWRTDWPVLTAVAGTFAFLPALAYKLLVPGLPQLAVPSGSTPDDAALQAYAAALQQWIGAYSIYYIVLTVVILFAQFALVAWYLTPRHVSAGQALVGAATLFARLLGASFVWALPIGAIAWVLMQVGLTIAAMPIYALALARTCLIGPSLVAERPIGAFAALVRSFRATHGHMLMLASLLLGVMLAQFLVGAPFEFADDWLRLHGPNPVVRAMVDAGAAGVAMLGVVAVALVQVAAWRRLAAR